MLYTLTEATPLNHDVTRLILQPQQQGGLPFHPGQYLEIVLPSGARCAYSIACAPSNDGRLELHVRAMPQSENFRELEPLLQTRATLEIALPFGDVWLPAPAADAPLLLLTGSTGFSQAKALLEQWIALDSPRELFLYWGGRQLRDLYLHDWMLTQAQRYPRLHYVPVISEADNQWQGRTGLVHKAVLEDFAIWPGVTIVGCGSPPMVYAALDDFVAAGMQASQMLSDVFAYAPR